MKIKFQIFILLFFTQMICVQAQDSLITDILFIKGQQDAKIYYKEYRTAAWATLVVASVSGGAGLIIAIPSSSITPIPSNLNCPDSVLFKNPDYYKGYLQKAHEIKWREVWRNWWIGTGVNVIWFTVLIITSLSQSD